MSHITQARQRRSARLPQRIQNRTGRGLLLGLALASPAVAQTSAFTDQPTGIQFQRFFGSRTNFGFGIALPTNPSNSFIGQLSFPLSNGAGWGGFSLTGDMEGPLLMACWSDGQGNVVSSFRQAFNEDDNPPEVTGSFSVRPIAAGTSVDNTFLTFTFLCDGCLDATLGLGAASTAGSAEMGWALASTPVRNPQSSNGILGFHNSGFGDFRANLAAARNAEFDTWAALAGDALSPSAGARAFDPNAGSGDEGGGSGGDSGDDSGDDSDDRFRAGPVRAGGAARTGRNKRAISRVNKANRRAATGLRTAVIEDSPTDDQALGRRQFNSSDDSGGFTSDGFESNGFTGNGFSSGDDSDSDFAGAAGRTRVASNRVAANRANRAATRRASTGQGVGTYRRRRLNRRQNFTDDSGNDSADSRDGFDSGDDTDDDFFGARGGATGRAASRTNRVVSRRAIRKHQADNQSLSRRQDFNTDNGDDSADSLNRGFTSGDDTDNDAPRAGIGAAGRGVATTGNRAAVNRGNRGASRRVVGGAAISGDRVRR